MFQVIQQQGGDMNFIRIVAVFAISTPAIPALADPYQEAVDGLMRASFRHMEQTYICRGLTGLSRYQDALVAAENAVRLTGVPTDLAMSTVAKMASNIETAPQRVRQPSLSDCAVGVTRTKQELLGWGAKFRRAQE
ncbi:hypothetical protein [Sinorhizobium mexicanum]|uniref:Uncharacterized protein n=1 Tax=Sinorhizobium mexicanum TaxID=375549 RepID=A0A859R2P1_9HYPH|nr:hypothetical protein [Sinorhizobium mexicanum]MBP1886510.1 hypothetical protein [Sinorhizobium mexicanum]QLL63918.1 hypothetical protein FKV68_20735 [Sinorhizobium mexicanum]